jgi:hypothetical protein
MLLDIEVGNLKRFRDNGIDKPAVTPKRWARAIPAARGIMTVTYTLEQVLFLSDGLAIKLRPYPHPSRAAARRAASALRFRGPQQRARAVGA